MPDLRPHSRAMGQKDGVLQERRSQRWTAQAHLQPTISQSDSLLEASLTDIFNGSAPDRRRGGPGPAGPLEASPRGKARSASGGYFNQPRLRKYHIGPSALVTIRANT